MMQGLWFRGVGDLDQATNNYDYNELSSTNQWLATH